MNESRTSKNTIENLTITLTYTQLVVIGTVMILICAVTIIGNALVMISFIVNKKLRTLKNYFLLSLAVSDIMKATFSMPLFIDYVLQGEWTLGTTLCDIWLVQDTICSTATCMNLLMIGFDRYYSVTSPIEYLTKMSPKRVRIMIGIVWVVAFLLWPPWVYAWPYIEGGRTVPDNDCYIQFEETNSYILIILSILDYAPVTITFVLYYKIWQRRNKLLTDMESKCQNVSMCLQKKKLRHDDKAARVLTAILLSFLVTTTPYNLLIVINNLDKTRSLVPYYLVHIASFLFYMNSTLNPVCYASVNKSFRKTYWKILTFSWNEKPSSSSTDRWPNVGKLWKGLVGQRSETSALPMMGQQSEPTKGEQGITNISNEVLIN